MRAGTTSFFFAATAAALFLIACSGGGDDGTDVDARRIDAASIDAPDTDAPDIDAPAIDAAVDAPTDAPTDARIDAPTDAMPTSSESIGFVRAASGAVNLPVENVTVTYIKPAIGGDPAGFTVQAEQMGPAVMIAVNPTTLTPNPVVGDVVSFTVTNVTVVSGQPRATAITGFSRVSQGADVNALSQNVTATANLATAIDMYESEILDLSGTIATNFVSAGTGFESAQITTTGIPTADPAFLLRVPSTLRNADDLVTGCQFTLDNTPIQKFVTATNPPQTLAQTSAFVAGDITVSNCPAPIVVAAVATSATSVNITFSRNVAVGSVMPDGSQFTFDNGLTASAASVSGRVVTVTTSVQVNGTMYIATVANTVTDTFGTALGTPNTTMFTAFMSPTHLVINEVDYDQTGTDANTFIEIYNPTPNPITLADFAVQYINGGAGAGAGAEYGTRVALSAAGTTLAAGGYIVIRNSTVTVPGGVATIDVTGDFLQNGGTSPATPDGLALINTSTNTLVDAISYEGSITAATITGFAAPVSLVEGTAFPTADPADDTSSIARFPNGLDSDNAISDWAVRTKTPGAAN